ncbi:hypothetical protein TEA_023606 [Camellia sinensis var. sinensis]|uniref:Uncharacterized protein n=1 Tax=Camellia sinensis var. sinensis TaxID=542762 RepID=A0A4S4D5D3_CAMSN|nr:hypothetical protein TEA_023606 [Camellia sinensis var. sinensis]
MLEDSQLKAPSIVVLSKKCTTTNVNVWHCASIEVLLILSRTKLVGLLERRRDLLLGGFGKSGSIIDIRRGCLSLSEIDVRKAGDGASDVDPGPSILKVGVARKDEIDKRWSIVMDNPKFSDVLRNVIMRVKKNDDVIVDDKGNVIKKFDSLSLLLSSAATFQPQPQPQPQPHAGPLKKMYAFGDSHTDTGNTGSISGPSGFSYVSNLPYGRTYFHHSTNRYSDGRLVIDFVA